MPELVDITNDGLFDNKSTPPLSRQTSVQSTKSINSVTTASLIPETQSTISTTPTEGSLSRAPSIKRDSMVSRSSTNGVGDQEPIIEETKNTELLSES